MAKNSDTPRAQVLIVEDEADHADVMAEALRRPGHVCTIVNDVPEAISELRGGTFDVIVTDLRMPNSAGAETPSGPVAADGGDAGMKILQASRELQDEAETIMVTAHGDVPTARDAFKHGAFDFIEKPLDLELFRSLVNRAAETVLLRHSGGELSDLVQHDGFEGIIAGSEPMRKIIETVRMVAPHKLPVLITGESGTGKELIAKAVHNNSPRKDKRFVAFNAAGQTESLIEDQLFGHVRGAFTGADKDREGVFEYANGGTLFLDEIGDMPESMQAKLLRVLETGEVIRVGANEAKHVDVRFVSATNRDLQKAITDGQFREDLFFRIKGALVHLPPLRERREDVPRIVRHAIAKFASDAGRPVPDVTDAAMMRLTAYAWPGNVRQLLNVVQNMVVAAGDGPIDVRHIPDDIVVGDDDEIDAGGAAAGSLAGTSLEQLEKRAIRETLKLTGGNREQTAKMLGIGERTLYRKLKEYGLR
ncbi:MAG: sigma-54 dependent transcriptional regulator [Planctomycetota bacterium]